MNLNLVYFSGAGTTKKIIRKISEGASSVLDDAEVIEFPLIEMDCAATTISKDDLAVFAIPVYSGRVPAIAAEQIRKFQGDKTRAILVAVYGNREYDDALLELSDIVRNNGFVPIAAGAFIAEHSIFPKVAEGRPDENDLSLAREFGHKAALIELSSESLKVPGNNPYRTPGNIPIAPKTNKSKCIKAVKKDKNACGICATACPVGAIGSPKPTTNSELCIKCARCIAVCPYDAREWGGLLYKLAEKKFVANNSTPKQSELFYL